PLFQGMEYTEDLEKLNEWIPLMTKDRTVDEPIAATRTEDGTDVNFGALTRELLDYVEDRNVDMHYSSVVKSIKQRDDGLWEVKVHHLIGDVTKTHVSKFVFIGAGGGSLPLLQKTSIPESKKVGGFPVGGDRKSTRLNSSHVSISYAVFCLKKKRQFSCCSSG